MNVLSPALPTADSRLCANRNNLDFYASGAWHSKMLISGAAKKDFTASFTDIRDKPVHVLNLKAQMLDRRSFTRTAFVDRDVDSTVAHAKAILFRLIERSKTKNLLAESPNLLQVFNSQRNMNNAWHKSSF